MNSSVHLSSNCTENMKTHNCSGTLRAACYKWTVKHTCLCFWVWDLFNVLWEMSLKNIISIKWTNSGKMSWYESHRLMMVTSRLWSGDQEGSTSCPHSRTFHQGDNDLKWQEPSLEIIKKKKKKMCTLAYDEYWSQFAGFWLHLWGVLLSSNFIPQSVCAFQIYLLMLAC